MYQARMGELQNTQSYKRSNRLIANGEGLHYQTREGELKGPFATESSALFDLNIFLEIVKIEKQINEDYGLQGAFD